MLSISLVSYLNTTPFSEGLKQEFDKNDLTINLLPPADCAKDLLEGNCDLALIPVGALLDFEGLEILKDHCIGANGPVNSVFLFSQVPIGEIKTVRLDPHSRTSNALIRIIFKKRGLKAKFVASKNRDFGKIKKQTAGVAIGDTAYQIEGQFAHVIDLAEEWKRLTGLPFVFAVWAARPGLLDRRLKTRLSRAFALGMRSKERCASIYGGQFGYSKEKAFAYLNDSISFEFDSEKHEAFRLYFKELLNLKPLTSPLTKD